MTTQPRPAYLQDASAYLHHRAEAELRMAENASCAAAAKAHNELANLYMERLGADRRHRG
ncbi:MAG TPA: hypothetical protein VF636_00735 [Sphingomonas sp.]|jgi:hypothetical protein